MKKSQLIALTALTATVAAAAAIYVYRKRKHEKRLITVSNAGYEMAYDVHYPIKYRAVK